MWQVIARPDDEYDNPISFSEPGIVISVFKKEMNKTYAASVSEEKLEQFGEDYGIDLSVL